MRVLCAALSRRQRYALADRNPRIKKNSVVEHWQQKISIMLAAPGWQILLLPTVRSRRIGSAGVETETTQGKNLTSFVGRSIVYPVDPANITLRCHPETIRLH